MPESIRFQSDAELQEVALSEKLKTDGGILYEEKNHPETGGPLKTVNVLGIELETYASEEDIQAIKKEIVLSEVDQELLKTIAECYKLKQPLLFEGDPGVGKTFLMKKFVQLIHGQDAPILELYGTPKTSELEILGHWSPKGLSEEQMEEYKELLKQSISNGDMIRLNEGLNSQLAELNDQFTGGQIEESVFQDQFGDITSQYVDESKRILFQMAQIAGFSQDRSEWEFKPGALLQAYAGRDGKGYPLICDEFNMIPSNYQQIFLQIGGNQGALSESISFWGNAGKTNYHRGKDAWICFASNFPEKTPGRSEVVAPMSDRLVWKIISQEDVAKKKETIIKSAGGRLKRKTQEVSGIEVRPPAAEQIKWSEVLDERLGEEIADIIYLLDDNFTKFYHEVGDTVEMRGQERRRTQQMEFSGRNALRLFSYLDNFQVRNKETGLIDFGQTIDNAFNRYYLERLASPQARDKMRAIFTELMDGKLGMKEVNETVKDSNDIVNEHLVGEKTPDIISRRQWLNRLIEKIGHFNPEKTVFWGSGGKDEQKFKEMAVMIAEKTGLKFVLIDERAEFENLESLGKMTGRIIESLIAAANKDMHEILDNQKIDSDCPNIKNIIARIGESCSSMLTGFVDKNEQDVLDKAFENADTQEVDEFFGRSLKDLNNIIKDIIDYYMEIKKEISSKENAVSLPDLKELFFCTDRKITLDGKKLATKFPVERLKIESLFRLSWELRTQLCKFIVNANDRVLSFAFDVSQTISSNEEKIYKLNKAYFAYPIIIFADQNPEEYKSVIRLNNESLFVTEDGLKKDDQDIEKTLMPSMISMIRMISNKQAVFIKTPRKSEDIINVIQE